MIVQWFGALNQPFVRGASGKVRKDKRTIFTRGRKLVKERSKSIRPFHPVAKWLCPFIGQTKKLVGGCKDGSRVEGRGWSWLLSWKGFMNHSPSRDPGRDSEGWNANAQLVKSKSIGGNRFVRSRDTIPCRGRDMIVETTMFIVSDEE